MAEIVEQHRRYLPHYQEKRRYYSLTWRLDGDLPNQIRQSIREMQAIMLQIKENTSTLQNEKLLDSYNQIIEKYDDQLGKHPSTGINLSDHKNAQIICDAFRFYHKKLYDLHAYCVMPNHIHLLIRPFSEEDGARVLISDIVKRIKSFTSKEIGKQNMRSGQLWRNDYFDRQIRHERDYYYCVQYILNNPVKAGLADTQKGWRFSYCCEWEA